MKIYFVYASIFLVVTVYLCDGAPKREREHESHHHLESSVKGPRSHPVGTKKETQHHKNMDKQQNVKGHEGSHGQHGREVKMNAKHGPHGREMKMNVKHGQHGKEMKMNVKHGQHGKEAKMSPKHGRHGREAMMNPKHGQHGRESSKDGKHGKKDKKYGLMRKRSKGSNKENRGKHFGGKVPQHKKTAEKKEMIHRK